MSELEKAQKALNDFLEEHPELKEYQAELDRRMDLAVTPEGRKAVISFMTAENLDRLSFEMQKLKELTQNFAETLRPEEEP